MRLPIAAVILLIFTTVAYCQTFSPKPRFETEKLVLSADRAHSPQLKSALLALRDAALADDYAYRQVAHLTDNIGPRATGSTQAQAAVEYVAGELRKLGLEVRLEEVRVPHWIRGVETAELV